MLRNGIILSPKQGKTGTGKVTITVFPNTTDEPRSTQIRITAGRRNRQWP
ncbi:hypothetical protein KSY30_00610 [Bacteroides uniformis]|nr:hypothetical protein [Bacteroides uniformis]MBV3893417.1 hypothetical protein [Bacteroides uniformis]MBV3897416.1 hypothetical protein [Bacteroides uniformis]MBV3915029.1 hypothetical protein [Bacteroides uniformis]MBV3977784.1 hypothetical protein [Bacteroides uniformis]